MKRHYRRKPGQALVEFTLAASLIFLLLSAAVDLGLIFFSFQALRAAAQEGATFGSYPVEMCGSSPCTSVASTVTEVRLNYAAIIQRVRDAAGNPSRGIVDLRDLNNNELDDVGEGIIPSAATAPVNNTWIRIDNPRGANASAADTGNVQCQTKTKGVDMRNAGRRCWVRVRVTYNYRFFFPLAPAFRETVPISAQFIIQVRSAYSDTQ